MNGPQFVPLFVVGWVGLYWLAVVLFVKLPEWAKPRLLRWLTEMEREDRRRTKRTPRG